MTKYEVWYQDGRTRKLSVVHVMAESPKDAIKIRKAKPVDCRRVIWK